MKKRPARGIPKGIPPSGRMQAHVDLGAKLVNCGLFGVS